MVPYPYKVQIQVAKMNDLGISESSYPVITISEFKTKKEADRFAQVIDHIALAMNEWKESSHDTR